MHKIILMLLLFSMVSLSNYVFWALPAFAQDALWSRTYGGSSQDFGRSVQQTTDGGYIVAGRTYSFGAGSDDVYLIKTDANGDIVWNRTYGGSDWDFGYSVQQTIDGGYIVAGRTYSFGAGSDDVYLIKTDANGDIVWNRTYGGSDWDFGYSVQQTIDGGYIVAGWTTSFGAGDHDVYLIKTNSTGDTLWSRTYGGSGEDEGRSVQQTTDGGYILLGVTNSFGAGGYDVYLIKTSSSGDTLWTRTYGHTGWDQGWSVQQTTDGGYIMGGFTTWFGTNYNAYLIKTDSLGDTFWTRTYGGGCLVNFVHGYSVQQTTDGGYIVAGLTNSFGAGVSDVMLTKLDALGNTCIGEFVSPTVMSEACFVTSPATVVTSPPTVVTSPPTIVTSPATEVDTVCWWVCGDVTGDGVVELGDVVYLINYLFRSGPAPEPLEAGDVNACDAVVELGDVVYLINYLFRNGPPPYCCPAW